MPCCGSILQVLGAMQRVAICCAPHNQSEGCFLPQVDLLLTWGINRGIAWDAAAQGPRGITALHLAALQKDSAMADLLTGSWWWLLSRDSCQALLAAQSAHKLQQTGQKLV